MINPSQAIADLQAQWHILQDLDRAEAVLTIHQAGVSLRRLAKALNCSEALLRHLLRAREASSEDLALARDGQISTSELARRSVATRTGRTSMHLEALEFEITKTAIIGSETVRAWLAEQSLDNPYGVQVTREARQLLASAEKLGKLPSGNVPYGLTTDEIIRRCRPPEPETQNAEVVSWYSRWLAIWASFAIPNARARQQALELAIGISRQVGGSMAGRTTD
jgi:hypothetical protein